MMRTISVAVVVALLGYNAVAAQAPAKIKAGAKIFIGPMADDFDSYIKAAIEKKKVPVTVVPARDQAEFELKGSAESQKAGAAKKVFMGSWHSDEQASISVTNIQTGDVVFAYSANKKSSAHGKQTTAEACAKHLKEEIEKAR